MAEVGQNILVDRVPLVLYYDSDRAFAKNRTLSGTWNIKGLHKVYKKVVRNGQIAYSIYNNTGTYPIGWVRAEDVTDPTINPPEPDPEPDPEEPEILPDMTLEKDGETINLFYGSNADKALVLHPGLNRIKIKGKGTVRFHWHDEVMG